MITAYEVSKNPGAVQWRVLWFFGRWSAVQLLEGERLHGEEVRSPELRAVVGEEGSPGLGRRRALRRPPIAPHRLRAHLVAERE